MPISPSGLKRYFAVPMNHTVSFTTLMTRHNICICGFNFQDSIPRQEKVRFIYIYYPQLSRILAKGFSILLHLHNVDMLVILKLIFSSIENCTRQG